MLNRLQQWIDDFNLAKSQSQRDATRPDEQTLQAMRPEQRQKQQDQMEQG